LNNSIQENEMKTETAEYKDGDVTLRGYLAYDDKVNGQRPGVLVMPQVCGLGAQAKTKAEKLEGLGYVAFAGDPYSNGLELDNLADAVKLAMELTKADAVCLKSGARTQKFHELG
jgi:dienelactone hydrolase